LMAPLLPPTRVIVTVAVPADSLTVTSGFPRKSVPGSLLPPGPPGVPTGGGVVEASPPPPPQALIVRTTTKGAKRPIPDNEFLFNGLSLCSVHECAPSE